MHSFHLLSNNLDVYSHKPYSILVSPTRYQRVDSWTVGRPSTKKERFWKPRDSRLQKDRRDKEGIARIECSHQKPIPEYL